jgi:AhpD family alkylhydroperoxidase
MSEVAVDMKASYNQIMDVVKRISEMDPDYAKAFMGFIQQAEKPGALSTKIKELISIACGVTAHCPFCIAYHVKNAINEGATKREIYEAGFVAGLMGGGPAIAYLRYLIDACDQFGAK